MNDIWESMSSHSPNPVKPHGVRGDDLEAAVNFAIGACDGGYAGDGTCADRRERLSRETE